ncbi:cell division protein ZapD [Shewanella sp. MMG014]|uniref:cell division protein ZapD n=1 Tax=Shewanella sp. MMG014 TaxID=2822691 RepID=UPI001B39BD73|nr:cell division protein ZapD [Shewanella sp. MMG014]MBQ4890869.1 cell division protein ZapD [Shewanella sp. MMG014]
MNNDLIYEQPLNEKTRSYLRLEYLADQLNSHANDDQQHHCFYPLFSLAELTDRCDYRSDILKDIDKQLIVLTKWHALPHVDKQQIQSIIDQLQAAKAPLQSNDRIGCKLKQDRFISALKQRFGMPGACCNFDLPQLHFWLSKPWNERQKDLKAWIANFEPILKPITLLLELTRSTAEFRTSEAEQGFYQGTSPQTLSLIRVKLSQSQGCYPTISGHKNRFAIHFVNFDSQKHTDKQIKFKLATCQ